jgi:FG-GAP repeat/Secretion system C-terminal sorting domain
MHDQRPDQQVVTDVALDNCKTRERSRGKKSLFRSLNSRSILIATIAVLFMYAGHAIAGDVQQLQKLVAADRGTDNLFGCHVAISGDYAIVGSQGSDNDANGANGMNDAGSAYIFVRNGETWTQQQKIVASDRASNDYFGGSVAISGDYAIVGAYTEDHDASGANAFEDAGAAYIFVRNGTTWTQQQKIVASDRAAGDGFGVYVDISGSDVVVGAKYETHDANGLNSFSQAGSAYIFVRSGTTWTQQQKIVASDRAANDYFGYVVKISGDYAIVGAPYEDHDANGLNSLTEAGSAYIFLRSGTTWTQQQKIVASDRAADDYFGGTVAISGDYAIIGAFSEDDDENGANTLNNAGSVYTFVRSGTTWTQQQKIVASDRATGDYFGGQVAISGDSLIVSATSDDHDANGINTLINAGSAYVFVRNGTNWNQQQKIVASDRSANDLFGRSVAISGHTVIIGTSYEDEDVSGQNTLSSAGSAYIFEPGITPSTQASNVVFSNVLVTRATVSWARGNGSKIAVFMKAASSTSALPVDGTAYTASTTFSSGTQIGSSGWYCIYNGTGTSVDVTGLSAGTTYRVMACEYNGSGLTATYASSDATANPANQTTAVSPIAQTITFPSMCSKDNTDIDFSPGATASSGLTVAYTSSNTSVASISGTNIHITGTGTTTITASQSGNSDYAAAISIGHSFTVVDRYLTFKIDDFSGYSSLLNSNGVAAISGTALKVADMTGVQWGSSFNTRKVTLGTGRKFSTHFVFNISNLINGGADGIVFVLQGATSSAGGGGGGMGYSGITGRSLGIEFDIWGNGANEGDGATNLNGAGNHIAIDTNCNVFNSVGFLETGVPELTGADRYAWIESDGDTVYVRIGTSNNRDAATLLKAALPNSNNIPADIYAGFTGATGGSGATFTVKKWYFDNDFHGCGLDPATAHTEAPTAVVLTPSGSGDTRTITANVKNSSGANASGISVALTVPSGDGTLSGYSGTTDASGNVSVTLTRNTSQTVMVRAAVAGGAFGETDIAFEPATQASTITFSNITTTSMTASWTRGTGTGVAVFAAAASSGSAAPVDGTTYSANTAFTSGTQITTSGWYCIYNGTGTTVNITGLTGATTYRVMVCEYSGTGAIVNYNSSNGTSNPAGQSTSKVPTVTTQAASSVAGVLATGNGTITDPGIPNPTAHGFCWNTTGNPTTADAIVDSGAVSTSGAFTGSLTGLTAGTMYYVRAYATNSAGTAYGDQVTFTANKLNPSITTWPSASAITYGHQLASSTLSGDVTVTAGTFAFTTPATAPNAGTANQPVTFSPTDTANYNTALQNVSVTVNKANPAITTWPSASAISYGQQLSLSTLSDGVSVTPGTFAFTTPATAPNAGTTNQPVTFTPTDTANYNTALQNVSVTVNKVNPSITTWPAASAIFYGQQLSSSTLSGGVSVTSGTFAFTTPATAPNAGTTNQSVTFTPADTVNYTSSGQNVSVTVNKAAPSITTWPTASSIAYGQTLAASMLSGESAATAGTFAFTTPQTAPATGTSGHSVTFTPTDTANYTPATHNVSVMVGKTVPVITTWPSASTITYGQPLSASTLSGQVVVTEGTFAFSTQAAHPTAGTAGYPVTFTPVDTVNYGVIVQNVNVTVTKAIPVITTWPTASGINYGQTLAASTLSGDILITAGTFTFDTPATAPQTGISNHSVTFKPADTTNYVSVNQSVSVTVGKSAPSITTWPTASAITYGQSLSSSTLGGAVVVTAGTFTFTNSLTVPSAGISNQSVTFTPADTVNYAKSVHTVSVTVNKATPSISTWPKASTIAFGQSLSSSVLSGYAAATSGSFTFTSLTTAPSIGTANQTVAFIPADTANYAIIVQGVSVTVDYPLEPVISTPPTVDKNGKTANPPRFFWKRTEHAIGYRLQIALVNGFNPSVIDTFVTDTFFISTKLTYNTEYFWRVTAVNDGGLGPWTPADTIWITPSKPAIPPIVSNPPETDSKGAVKNPPKFTWDKVPGTTVYHIQLSRDGGFNPSVVDTCVSDTTFLCDTLDQGVVYYWRIAAVNTDGSGPFTPRDSIRTGILPPTTAPVIASLFPDTVKVGSSVQLSWNNTDTSIHRYRIQICTDPSFGQSFIDTVIYDLDAFLAHNLGADTKWFYRIAAVNDGGNGPWSSVNSFTTSPADTGSKQIVSVIVVDSQATPLPRVKVSTGGDTTLKNLVITVAEKNDSIKDTATTQVSGIYDFTKSPVTVLRDTILITLAIPDKFIDGTLITQKDLPDIRVFRVNSDGGLKIIHDAKIDTFARTVSFRTDRLDIVTLAIDRLPPRIVDKTANQVKSSGTTPVVSGQILDNIANCQAYIYFRKGGDRGYDSLPVTINADGTFESALNGRTLDMNGFEYFIGANDGTTRVTVERRDIPVALSAINDTALFPVSQWYQFSAPLTLSDTRVSALLKDMGNYGKDWKLFRRSLTSVADSFIEYGPDFNAVSTGYSYWLKTTKANLRIVADSGTTTPVSKCYEITIPARTWASIGVPYMFAVGWQSIIDSTGTDADSIIGPYTWQTNAWTPPVDVNNLAPWQGYYVYNARHSAVRIRIPSIRHSEGLAKMVATAGIKKLEWSISSKDGTDCRNYFGFVPGAHNGFNKGLDCPKPGSLPSAAPVTWFTRDEFAGIAKKFQTDFTDASNGGASWTIVAGSLKAGESYSCNVIGADSLDDTLACVLVDSRSGAVHDMRTGSYTFTPFENESERPFRILSGTSGYVSTQLSKTRLAPREFMLSHIYPNPVRNTAIIRYSLPWSLNGIPVKLDIIDIRGRLVTTLVNKVQYDGYYTVQWNVNNNKSAVSSGIYILRLHAGKSRKTTQLQVIR